MTELATRTEGENRSAQDRRVTSSFGRRLLWLGPTGIAVATALSVVEWLIVTGPDNNGSAPAALLALTMTAPVVMARRWPVQAAAVVLIAALLNGVVFADLVRCGGALPAALYIAFAVGACSREGGRGWLWTIAGLILTMLALIAQWVWDPALHGGSDFLPVGLGVAALCCGAGIGWSALARRIATRRGDRRSDASV